MAYEGSERRVERHLTRFIEGNFERSISLVLELLGQPLDEAESEAVAWLKLFEQEFKDRQPLFATEEDIVYVSAFFAVICAQTARLIIAVDRQGFQGEDVGLALEALNASRAEFDLLCSSSPLWREYCSVSPSGFDLRYTIGEELEEGVDNNSVSVFIGDDELPLTEEMYEVLSQTIPKLKYMASLAVGGTYVGEFTVPFRENSIDDNLVMLDYLAHRVAFERAAWANNYVAALEHLSASSTREGARKPLRSPWSLGNSSERAIHWCEELKQRSRLAPGSVDWDSVTRSFTTINEHGDDETLAYWHRLMGFVEAELTPSQLRTLYDDREDERAATRLRKYFFPDPLWESMSKNAQEALVRVDRSFVSATQGGWGGIASDLRVATGELLGHCLWKPLIAWVVEQQAYALADSSAIRRAEELLRDDPLDLHAYEEILLPDPKTSAFLKNELRLPQKDYEFIRHRVPKFLSQLRAARNSSQHRTDYTPNHAQLHSLYAGALGIGGTGVLPALLRLTWITKRKNDGGGDSSPRPE